MSKRWISIAGVILFLIAVFCAGFAFFYNRIQRSRADAPEEVTSAPKTDSSKSLIDKPLPHGQLVDVRGTNVDEQILRKGRVVLVFLTPDCDACVTESNFLETVVARRKDVSYYGVVPFGGRPDSPEAVEKAFPFRIFYDDSGTFVTTMGINRVPVKVYLEDGIIKKGWIGATLTDQNKTSFTEWLINLP